MHGLLVMLLGCFCWMTSLQMVTRDVWQQGLSAVFFFLMGGVEELQALADVIAGVRAGVSDTRSAAVGKTSFTLAAEAGIDEANVRAHHPTFCTVLPRRLDLIASHVGPSPCGCNVALKGSRGHSARHLYSSVEVSRGKEMRAF
ncbi:mucin-associated surface protein (MASP) [Trypanosoma cruzi]|nr:mucin-associated surface protein (MASP) [Trypanosoma cruzi]